jgi:large subunit ribosomal protein L25
MDQKLLNARTRTVSGKGAAKRLRGEGRLPAVMYDRHGKAVMIDIDEQEFGKLFHRITESTIVKVKVDGSKDVEVFVKDTQYDIVDDSFLHVDLYEIEQGRVLRTKIPVRLTGTPEGVRSGAVLETGAPEIEVECLPKDLPERVVVDVSGLQLNHSLHVRDIKLPGAVKVLTDLELSIATLRFAKADAAAAPAAAATAAARLPPAAPAAPRPPPRRPRRSKPDLGEDVRLRPLGVGRTFFFPRGDGMQSTQDRVRSSLASLPGFLGLPSSSPARAARIPSPSSSSLPG